MNDTTSSVAPKRVRHYHTTNANWEFQLGKERLGVRFEPYAVEAGALYGMLRTDDPAQQELLTKLIEAKQNVREITEAEFWANLGVRPVGQSGVFQKPEPLTITAPPPPPPLPPAGESLEVKVGVVVEGAEAAGAAPVTVSSEPVENVAEVLQVGDVNPQAAEAAKKARGSQGRRNQPPKPPTEN